jgi:hypothetical protein
MQTSGTFPQLSDGRKKSKSAKKARREPMEDGQGWTSRQPRPINAPKTTSGRREQAHKKAAATMKKGC